MKQRINALAALICIWVAGSSASNATISGPPASIEDRYAKSDFVCICVVTGIAQTNPPLAAGRLVPADYKATIRVENTLKGGPKIREASVVFSGVDPQMGPPLPAHLKYLLFLIRKQAAEFQLADRDQLIVIPEDLSLEIGAADLGAFEANLTDALRRHADDPEGIDLLRLLLQFQKLSSPTVSELESLSQGPFSRLAVLSLEALCRASGDPTPFVSKLIAMLVEFDTKAPSDLASIGDELSDVGDTIANQATSADLEGLERLANSRTGALRWSSMLAVRRLRNPNTVPFLVTALDSEDDMVQYEAVISLAEITRQYGDFAPGKGLYDQNPAKYKGMWKDWYQRQGGKTAVTGGGARPQ